jgi:hypothetical protein
MEKSKRPASFQIRFGPSRCKDIEGAKVHLRFAGAYESKNLVENKTMIDSKSLTTKGSLKNAKENQSIV